MHAAEKFQTFDQQIADRFSNDRMIGRLTSLFGALALMLATIGLYGVSASTVVRRTPEIGIRMGLGAERIRVIGMVVPGAMMQALIGLIIGIPIAMLCVRNVKAQLYDIPMWMLRSWREHYRANRGGVYCGPGSRPSRSLHRSGEGAASGIMPRRFD